MTHPEHTPASPNRKRPLAPDLRDLSDRAVRAWTESMAVEPLGSGRYAVNAESGNRYVVDLRAGTCTCPDQTIRRERCKHLRRTAIEVTRKTVPAPGEKRIRCRKCRADTFVPESRSVSLCSECLFRPGTLVRDKERGDILVVCGYAEEPARSREISGANCTVSDYPSNRNYPDDDPVVLASFGGGESATEYAYPNSRLEAIRTTENRAGRVPPTSSV